MKALVLGKDLETRECNKPLKPLVCPYEVILNQGMVLPLERWSTSFPTSYGVEQP
jgi:hypothetical protein